MLHANDAGANDRVLAEKDRRIAELEREVSVLRAQLATQTTRLREKQTSPARPASQPARAVEVTRIKRRHGEAERKAMRDKHRQQAKNREQQQAGNAGEKAVLEGRSFLYVGGRDCQVAHLRQIASSYGANLIHHDGGLREAVSRIDNVLPSVDCVFCPIDCISHDACLRVKTGCKKWEKAFVPLRNGSKSSFARALESLSQGDSIQ